MAKFVLQSEKRKSSKVVLVHAGVTTFDENGVAEVELETEQQLSQLLNSYPDIALKVEQASWEALPVTPPESGQTGNDPIKPQVDENELGKSQDEQNDIGGEQDGGEDEIAVEVATGEAGTASGGETEADFFDGLKVEELKELALESGFPEDEWKNLKKDDLKSYLKSKLQ